MIDGYSDFEEIGRGGFGVVYRARNDVLGRVEAVKVVDEGLSDILAEEGRVLGELCHRNIVTVYGLCDNRLFMEYVPGGNFGQQKKEFSETIDTGLDIIQALEEAHRVNVIHGDIKPENIIGYEPKLCDFGWWCQKEDILNSITRTCKAIGTYEYMSPEQKQGVVDKRSDFYSLALVLYESIANDLPFAKFDLGDTDEALVRLIQKNLEKDPEKRSGSATDFRCELERVRHGKQYLESRLKRLEKEMIMLSGYLATHPLGFNLYVEPRLNKELQELYALLSHSNPKQVKRNLRSCQAAQRTLQNLADRRDGADLFQGLMKIKPKLWVRKPKVLKLCYDRKYETRIVDYDSDLGNPLHVGEGQHVIIKGANLRYQFISVSKGGKLTIDGTRRRPVTIKCDYIEHKGEGSYKHLNLEADELSIYSAITLEQCVLRCDTQVRDVQGIRISKTQIDSKSLSFTDTKVSLEDLTFTEGIKALIAENSDLTMKRVTIYGYFDSALEVHSSQIRIKRLFASENGRPTNPPIELIDCDTIIENSHLVRNLGNLGGALFIKEGTARIRNTLIAENHADEGGAIYALDTRLDCKKVRLLGNKAKFEPAICNKDSVVKFKGKQKGNFELKRST